MALDILGLHLSAGALSSLSQLCTGGEPSNCRAVEVPNLGIPLSSDRDRTRIERAFWNEKEHQLVSVVFMGSGIEGWPTVVHGGALGTIIDENLGRAAVRHFPARTGMTANLNIDYRTLVYSDNFYSIHSTLSPEQSTDSKAYVRCEIRDMTGRVCVEANGLFVVPKKLKLVKLGDRF